MSCGCKNECPCCDCGHKPLKPICEEQLADANEAILAAAHILFEYIDAYGLEDDEEDEQDDWSCDDDYCDCKHECGHRPPCNHKPECGCQNYYSNDKKYDCCDCRRHHDCGCKKTSGCGCWGRA